MGAAIYSFLGGVGRRSVGEYQKTTYRFADGFEHESSFCTVSLLEWFRSRRPSDMPDRLVLFGTASSWWDSVGLTLAGPLDDDLLALCETMFAAAQAKSVDDAMLRPLAARVSAALGLDAQLRVIPFCDTVEEAAALVALMADTTRRGERLHVDITHSLRHLPLLSLLAGIVAESLKGATVAGVYYGAFDRERAGPTPVLQLEGVLAATRWIRALAAYDASGDVGRLAGPVGAEVGAAAAADLARAAFAEKTMHLEAAAAPIARTLAALGRTHGTLTPLFVPAIRSALAWAGEADPVRLRVRLARQRLAAGDHGRAAIIACEAAVMTLWQEVGGSPDVDGEERQQELRRLLRAAGPAMHAEREAFAALKDVRNAFAHARPPHQKRARQAMASPRALDAFFAEVFATLFGEDAAAPPPPRPATGRTLFVTRHQGAVEWAARHGHAAAERISHLDVASVAAGDVVIGSLPAHLAAEICDRGARYIHLALDLPEKDRGRNLSADEMEGFGARLVEVSAAVVG